jgi:SPP1 gp7 family putative phage head morphogenesis protein
MKTQNSKVGRTYLGYSGQMKQVNLRMSSQDIASWRQAIDSARNINNPKRRLLYELFENIVLDGHLLSVMNKRRTNITNKRLHYAIAGAEGETDDFVRDSITHTPWFHTMIGHLQDSKPWGHSVVELVPENGLIKSAELIPRINVRPETGFIALDAMNDSIGIYIEDDPMYSKYLVATGGKKNYGLLMTAAQYVIYKRGGFGDWAQFAELFGMPFRVGKYNPYDDSTRQVLDSALKDMGGAAHIVIPDGTAIEFINNNGTGKSEVFEKLIEVCNAEVSKLFLGQTMTTENGSSRSQSETHKEVEEDITMSDMIEMEYLINWSFKNQLAQIGYKIPDGRFFYPQTENIPLDKRLEMDIQLAGIIDVSQEYFYEKYGIERPEAGQVPVKINGAAPALIPEAEPAPGQKKKSPKIEAALTPEAPHCCLYEYITKSFVAIQASAHELSPEEELFLRAIYDQQLGEYDPSLYQNTIDKLRQGIAKGLPLNTAYNTPDHLAETMMEANVNRFGFDKTLAQIYQLNQALDLNETYEQFKAKARGILEVFDSHLETEYNFAVATAQNAANWNRQKAQKSLFPYLKYQTAGDNRVRPEHAAIDGKIYSIDEPIVQRIYPPNGFGCRCEMIQLRADEVKPGQITSGEQTVALLGDQWDKMLQGGFAVNRGELNQVFDLNKGYIKQLPSGKAKPNNLTYEDAGLPTFDSLAKKNKYPALPKAPMSLDGIKDEVARLKDYPTRNGKPFIQTDYAGRQIAYPSSVIAKHLKGKYISNDQERHLIYGNIHSVISHPDEVWFQSYKAGFQYTYIKYYNDEPMAVIARFADDQETGQGLQVMTWFKCEFPKLEKDVRVGMVIKAKG